MLVAKRPQTLLEQRAHASRVPDQVSVQQFAHRCEPDRAGHRVPSVCVPGAELDVLVDLAPERPRHALLDEHT